MRFVHKNDKITITNSNSTFQVNMCVLKVTQVSDCTVHPGVTSMLLKYVRNNRERKKNMQQDLSGQKIKTHSKLKSISSKLLI